MDCGQILNARTRASGEPHVLGLSFQELRNKKLKISSSVQEPVKRQDNMRRNDFLQANSALSDYRKLEQIV
jgi:hypothetical protein